MKKIFSLFILGLLAAAGVWVCSGGERASAGHTAQLIRFHVIANSDSAADQALKLQVRDAVLQAMTPVLSGAEDLGEARARVDANLDLIAATAGKVVAQKGYSYPVAVFRGEYDFPRKTYRISGGEKGEVSDLTLPAGKYEAVRVVIGSGRGANWWCVLFPPLCFVNPADQAAPPPPQDTPAFKYDRIAPEKAEVSPAVEYRFKVAEWYRGIRDWGLGVRD